MKLALLLLALAGCSVERPKPIPTELQAYIMDVCYEREGEEQRSCIAEARAQALGDVIPVSREEWLRIEERLCGENGSVSRDDDGPVCG